MLRLLLQYCLKICLSVCQYRISTDSHIPNSCHCAQVWQPWTFGREKGCGHFNELSSKRCTIAGISIWRVCKWMLPDHTWRVIALAWWTCERWLLDQLTHHKMKLIMEDCEVTVSIWLLSRSINFFIARYDLILRTQRRKVYDLDDNTLLYDYDIYRRLPRQQEGNPSSPSWKYDLCGVTFRDSHMRRGEIIRTTIASS